MKFRVNRPPQNRQRGQAIIWFLATMVACICAFALVYNVGQIANKKEETTNAADAAALSGAIVEARILNFDAYTNRAIVANEVTIAQLVSLDSFARFQSTLTQVIADYTIIVPYLDDVTQALADGASYLQDAADYALYSVPVISAFDNGLGLTENAVTLVGALAADQVSSEIAKANATTFNGTLTDEPAETSGSGVALGLNEYVWAGFTQLNSGDGRATLKDAVLNSRDPFSTKRENGFIVNTINTALKLAGLASLGTEYYQLDKTSKTTVLKDYDHWAAQDSIDLDHTTIDFCFGFIPCGLITLPEPVPVAWGRADADSDGSNDPNLCEEFQITIGVGVPVPTPNCLLAQENAANVDYMGLPSVRDLASGLATNDPCTVDNGSDSPSLPYVMAVQKPGKATLTTSRLGLDAPVAGPQGSPAMPDNLAGDDHLTSVAAACVFFLRPDGNMQDITQGHLARFDGVHEYASLYSPYWQARLGEIDKTLGLALATASNARGDIYFFQRTLTE